ncbi:MAG: SDR family oxidoreductase [Acidobacteriota bacterium]|nr:SDR family oxidoreductase [Acidobacteriota bacterium]
MPVSLRDKVVLVLGASSGIGRAVAQLFAAEGARVMAAARRENRLAELQNEMAKAGHRIEVHACDASNAAEVESLANLTRDRLGKIDFLIYVTGTNVKNRALKNMDVPTWDRMISVNLNGAYYATQAVLPAMREAQSGYLIYVSSISGLIADVSGASYQAAKRGLIGLAHAIRVEEKENGIRTCAVCPGLVDTEILENRPVKPGADVMQHALQSEDIAEAILAIAKLPERAVVPEIQVLPTCL